MNPGGLLSPAADAMARAAGEPRTLSLRLSRILSRHRSGSLPPGSKLHDSRLVFRWSETVRVREANRVPRGQASEV
jgi:hypothetical protein